MSENDSQNQDSTENALPTSPQEPTEQGTENTAQSEPAEASPEPQEAQGEAFESKVTSEHLPENQGNEENKGQTDQTPQTGENQDSESSKNETAQTPPNEPLDNSQDKPFEQEEKEDTKLSNIKWKRTKQLLEIARNVIQFRKRKKLDRVMSLFLKQSKITNDEVEKLLHVSDATATRYLSQLEKEGRIKQSGKTGKGVSYSRI